jgi:dimethylhistidine N-methyltransferase
MITHTTFYNDVLKGLQASPKYLPSKYFYDAAGNTLFQKIMDAPEYYVTDADLEIFSQQSAQLAKTLVNGDENFEILELGAGDALKSTYLLQSLTNAEKKYTYRPIDISLSIIDFLHSEMPQRVSGIAINGLAGEYLPMLEEAYRQSPNKKLLLFLGSSIGNFELDDARKFLLAVHKVMQPGELILIGFDLKKDPHQILAAYNDAAGLTKAFNLNLLSRINKELGAELDLDAFEHFPTYNPVTGSCRSYLVSKKQQLISIPGAPDILLEKHEPIDMELSQKFSVGEIDAMAAELGFNPRPYFFDEKGCYCNAIWEKK